MPDSVLPHHHTDHRDSLFLQQALSSTREFGVVAELFDQLSDPTRLRIFWMLCHCEECVINIAAVLEITSPPCWKCPAPQSHTISAPCAIPASSSADERARRSFTGPVTLRSSSCCIT